METRANYVVVGLFTLAVIAGGFGFVYWFSRAGDGSERATYRVVFDGAVSGLRTGGWVLFNGIKVGEVADLRLNPHNPRQVIATINIDRAVPVRADTKVGLDFQGLTGIAAISVKGGAPDAPALLGENGQPPTLVAEAAATQDVTATIRDVAANAGALVRRVDDMLAENRDTLKTTLGNLESFSAALARNSERLDRVMAGLENFTSDDIKTELIDTARSMRTLSDNLDKRTAEISVGLTHFSNNGLREYEALAVDARRTLADLGRAIRNFDRNPQRVIFGPSTSDAQPPAETPRAAPAPRTSQPPRASQAPRTSRAPQAARPSQAARGGAPEARASAAQ
jgi:phospholipid/cholesterol/gamma-HCH transport system substrate-binding protein